MIKAQAPRQRHGGEKLACHKASRSRAPPPHAFSGVQRGITIGVPRCRSGRQCMISSRILCGTTEVVPLPGNAGESARATRSFRGPARYHYRGPSLPLGTTTTPHEQPRGFHHAGDMNGRGFSPSRSVCVFPAGFCG
jgi:hypothetical protein